MTETPVFEALKTRAAATKQYSPHFIGIGLNSLVTLETSVANPDTKAERIGESLAFFLRTMDGWSNELRWENAPSEVTARALAMRDIAVDRIKEAGLDPASYGYGVAPE